MTSAYDTLQMEPRKPIPRNDLTDAEAIALLASREPSEDVVHRFYGWVTETAKQEVAGRTYCHVSEEVAAFVRAHRPMIESLPAKIN